MDGTDKRARTMLLIGVLATAAFACYLVMGLPLGIPGEWASPLTCCPHCSRRFSFSPSCGVSPAWSGGR